MVIFKRRQANRGVASHLVGEVGICDLRIKTVKIHHYIDLGPGSLYRQLFPEYEDANAQSYTSMPKANMTLKPDSSNSVLELIGVSHISCRD